MRKCITLITACSLGLAIGVCAQQDDQRQQEKKKERQHARAQTHEEQGAPSSSQSQQAPRHSGQRMNRQGNQTQSPASDRMQNRQRRGETNPSSGQNGAAAESARQRRGQERTTPAETKTNTQSQGEETRQQGRNAGTQPQGAEKTEAGKTNTRSQAAETTQAGKTNTQAQGTTVTQTGRSPAPERKVAAQKARANAPAIKARNANFHATPKPQQVKSVTFNQNYRITNAEHWQGPQYVAFRSYRPVWHDQAWYHSHYNRVVLIAGGWYYFNNGFWYPAWGYAPSAQYYAYDGPIYAGRQAEPPDKVIADVQASLQEQGYYKGEVDGLLGPLTREALTGYQADNGLYTTGAIDEPTLSSLGMA